jgi:phenylpyruvate tautomerase PptA (4-oxalocrotonate tautomerase family)
MPFITVKVPAGVLGDTAKAALTSGICAAAAECEQVPDDPRMRALCVVTIEEIGAGNRTYGGRDLSQMLVSVDAAVNVPKGILDDRRRARFVELLHQAVIDALADEKRRITSSFIINEIEDGMWGVSGELWKLPDFAAASGYRHLQHLVVNR